MKLAHAVLILPLAVSCAKGSGGKESPVETILIEHIKLDQLCITILYDNTCYFDEYEADWGFACLIEGPEKTILFDTGAKGDVLMSNIDGMNLDPGKVEVIVLSHEHWDHVGGLESFLARNPDVSVHVLKSFPKGIKDKVGDSGAELVEATGPQEICTGVYSTGTMGEGIEEQSVVITTDKGALVITGCAHPGIVEIVKKVKDFTGEEILMVMGGFHLMQYSQSRMVKVIDQFKEMDVLYAAPSHCTGEEQIKAFREAYGEGYKELGVGREITAVDFVRTH